MLNIPPYSDNNLSISKIIHGQFKIHRHFSPQATFSFSVCVKYVIFEKWDYISWLFNNIRYVIFFWFFFLFKTFFKRFICLIKQIYAFKCFACMYVYAQHTCAWCLWRSKERGIRSPGYGVSGWLWVTMWELGTKPGQRQRQEML